MKLPLEQVGRKEAGTIRRGEERKRCRARHVRIAGRVVFFPCETMTASAHGVYFGPVRGLSETDDGYEAAVVETGGVQAAKSARSRPVLGDGPWVLIREGAEMR